MQSTRVHKLKRRVTVEQKTGTVKSLKVIHGCSSEKKPLLLPSILIADQILNCDQVLGAVEDLWYETGESLYQFLDLLFFGEISHGHAFSPSFDCKEKGEKN